MSHIYRVGNDPERCKEKVHDPSGWGMNQCSRKAKIEGYCKQHSPEAVAARQKESHERYQRQAARARAPYEKIGRLEARVKELEDEVQELNRYIQEVSEHHDLGSY